MAEAVATTRVPSVKVQEYRGDRAGLSAAHFVKPFPETLVLPPLFPFLSAQLGLAFIELGFATDARQISSRSWCNLPVGILVDRLGSRADG